jgi:hypothetical protein
VTDPVERAPLARTRPEWALRRTVALARRPRRSPERWPTVLLLALLAGVGMLVFPALPVIQHTATYHWDGAAPAALPLSPYRPERLTLTVDCAQAGAHPGQLLDTVRAVDEDMRAARGRIALTGGALQLTLRGEALTTPVPACETMAIDIDTAAVTVTADGQEVFRHAGDLRPAVDSLSSGPGVRGVSATVVADTQWDSSPSTLKVLVGTVSAALLAVALALAALGNRPRRRWRARFRAGVDDAVVLGAIVVGVVAGGATDDDGFIAQIIRTPGMSGYVGNYVRWNNAPEAPFGWFYELYARWGHISMEPVWLRLLPALLAVVGWLLLRHVLAPRLLPALTGASRVALAAGFTLLWLVFANSLRPELWFAVGSGIVLFCVLDALHRRSIWPLLVGALVAGLTVGTGPTGLVAVAPFVVAAPALWRWLRPTPIRALAAATAWLASLGAVVLLMFADQSFASVLSSNRARAEYGPIYPFWQDVVRYWKLWWSFAARQFSVYLTVVALGFLAWRLRRRGAGLPGVNRTVSRHVVGGGIALLLVMLVAPTKLPHHFGAWLLLGPLAMAAGAQVLARRVNATAAAALVGGSVVAVGLSLHHNNTWWKLSTLGLLLDKNPLRIGPVPLWPFVVLAGVLLIGWLLRRRTAVHSGRWPIIYALGLAVLSGSQYANFAQAAAARGPDRYTMASAALSAIAGEPCKLERSLHFEPDPGRGALSAPDDGAPDPFTRPATSGLLGWAADPVAPDRMETGWYVLPDSVRDGRWPLVIAVSGIDDGHRVTVEYDNGTERELVPTRKTLATSDLSDIRLHPSAEIARFRIVAESDGPATPDAETGEERAFVIAQPRVPITHSLLDLNGRESVAIAWNLAFFAPCLDTPHQGNGRVEIADYILSDSEQPGNMSYHSRSGGPFAGVLGLTEPSRVPLYAKSDYTEAEMSAFDLIRLVPGETVGHRLDIELGTRRRGGLEGVPAVP